MLECANFRENAAANLLIVCFGVIFLEDSQSFKESWEESWIYIVGLVLFLFIARSGVLLLRRGWKYDATPAEKLLERDRRPPVVYIRSFKDDDKIMLGSSRVRRLLTPLAFTAAITPEQELAIIMNRAGPVVAIGRPGEALPELGAARLYVGDDQWRNKITDLMKRARLVVIRGGATANLWWEIDQARMLLPPRKLILVSLGKDKDAKSFEAEVEKKFGRPESSDAPRKRLLLRRLVSLMMPLGKTSAESFILVKTRNPTRNPSASLCPVGNGSSWRRIDLIENRSIQPSGGCLSSSICRGSIVRTGLRQPC